MAKQTQPTTPKTTPATPTLAADKRLSRAAAANMVIAAIDGPTTLSELAQAADALFVERGGKSKLPAATHHVRRGLETAAALGAVKLTKPTDVLVSKAK